MSAFVILPGIRAYINSNMNSIRLYISSVMVITCQCLDSTGWKCGKEGLNAGVAMLFRRLVVLKREKVNTGLLLVYWYIG